MKWIGSDGNWSNIDNWELNRLPDENDILYFNYETILIDCYAVCKKINGDPEFFGVSDSSLIVDGVKWL